jgi:hypothetical protein
MVPARSLLTLNVTGQANGLYADREALRSGVIGLLSRHFDVITASVTTGSLFSNAIGFEWVFYQYTARLEIRTRGAYAEARDVASVVANAFYQTGGELPTVSVAGLDPPQTAGTITTGPELPNLGAVVDDLITGVGNLVSGITRPITEPAERISFVVVAGILVLGYFVFFGPQTGHIARAASPFR